MAMSQYRSYMFLVLVLLLLSSHVYLAPTHVPKNALRLQPSPETPQVPSRVHLASTHAASKKPLRLQQSRETPHVASRVHLQASTYTSKNAFPKPPKPAPRPPSLPNSISSKTTIPKKIKAAPPHRHRSRHTTTTYIRRISITPLIRRPRKGRKSTPRVTVITYKTVTHASEETGERVKKRCEKWAGKRRLRKEVWGWWVGKGVKSDKVFWRC
ncbi:hypothetical protein BC829DRAFT_444582 [Chytridium lagenaria]|nr:hypothetical protein BC829DRAFT_444582 [Chytridium lagenaria]